MYPYSYMDTSYPLKADGEGFSLSLAERRILCDIMADVKSTQTLRLQMRSEGSTKNE